LQPESVAVTLNINVTMDTDGSCRWTYQLDVDETRVPPVIVVARCLNRSRCAPDNTNETVEPEPSDTSDPYNPDNYDDGHDS